MLRSALHHRPDETAGSIVDIHDELAGDETVGEGHDPAAALLLEPAIDDEGGSQPAVHRSHVADGAPHRLGGSVEQHFFADGSHMCVSSSRLSCCKLVA